MINMTILVINNEYYLDLSVQIALNKKDQDPEDEASEEEMKREFTNESRTLKGLTWPMRVLDSKVYKDKGWYVWEILPVEESVKPEVVSGSSTDAVE